MVKCMTRSPDGMAHVALGLSRCNIERLIEGKPILIDEDATRELGLGNAQILIFFGETEIHMEKMLREYAMIGPNTVRKGVQL